MEKEMQGLKVKVEFAGGSREVDFKIIDTPDKVVFWADGFWDSIEGEWFAMDILNMTLLGPNAERGTAMNIVDGLITSDGLVFPDVKAIIEAAKRGDASYL